MRKGKQHYSKEFKIKAVELSKQRGDDLKGVSKELGISRVRLVNWKKDYDAGLYHHSERTLPLKSKEALENLELRKALRDAEMERDILKKALGIFSKSDR
jgi:transposase